MDSELESSIGTLGELRNKIHSALTGCFEDIAALLGSGAHKFDMAMEAPFAGYQLQISARQRSDEPQVYLLTGEETSGGHRQALPQEFWTDPEMVAVLAFAQVLRAEYAAAAQGPITILVDALSGYDEF